MKVVAKKLTADLTAHNILDIFQPGFHLKHSNETALPGISSDIRTSSDVDECSVLLLLDLSAAFNSVNHTILTEGLRQWEGVSGLALPMAFRYTLFNKSILKTLYHWSRSGLDINLGRHFRMMCLSVCFQIGSGKLHFSGGHKHNNLIIVIFLLIGKHLVTRLL